MSQSSTESSDPYDSSDPPDSDDSYSEDKSNSEQSNSKTKSNEIETKEAPNPKESTTNDTPESSKINSNSDDDQSTESSQQKQNGSDTETESEGSAKQQSNAEPEKEIKQASQSYTSDSSDPEREKEPQNETKQQSDHESGSQDSSNSEDIKASNSQQAKKEPSSDSTDSEDSEQKNKNSSSEEENKQEVQSREQKVQSKETDSNQVSLKERSSNASTTQINKTKNEKEVKNKKSSIDEKSPSKRSTNKNKKSSLHSSRRSKKQSRKNGDDDDDENEYESDSNQGPTRKSKSSSGRPSSQMADEEIDEAIEREDAEIEAVYQFNTRKNVTKLCSYFNAEETPEGIAHVIRTTKGLNGEVIGDYLGKKENSKILSAYFMEVDMKCGYIEAMRRSLSGPMFLPGEGQIIDRILQEFSNCYVQQNPGKYSNADELYVLSFALVMLNSDLHNRNVQNRMTVKDFIRNTRHLLSADDVTDKELTEMYNEIQSTPFSFTNHSNDFWWEVAPKIRGYLQKRSEHSFTKWTKKYFVLTNSCLYYFRDDNPANEGNPLGVIQLTEVEVNADKDPLIIKITAANDEISYVKFKKIPKPVKGIKKISFKAPDRASASRWLHRIKKSAIMSNFLGEKMNENIDQKM